MYFVDEKIQEIGLNIARLRVEKGYSVAELAEKSGLSKATINGIENGKNFRIDSFLKLCNVLEVSASVIMGEGNSFDLETTKQLRSLAESFTVNFKSSENCIIKMLKSAMEIVSLVENKIGRR